MLKGLGIWRCAVCMAVLVGLGCAQAEPAKTSPCQERKMKLPQIPNVDRAVEFAGDGLATPRTFSFDQLAAVEMQTLEGVLMERSHAPDIKTGWRGPGLLELLTQSGLKPGPMILTIEATDGYTMKVGLDVLESAIIALQDGDGKWLADVKPDCPIRLIAPKATANYWVANINRITVTPRAG